MHDTGQRERMDENKVVEARIAEERARISAERRTMVKDGLVLLLIAAALTAFLLVWRAEITGLAALDNSVEEGAFCVDYAGFRFISGDMIVLSEAEGYSHQLELGCLPGKTVLHEDSGHLDIGPDGMVRLIGDSPRPAAVDAVVIARHESGEDIYKRVIFEVR